MSMLCYGNQPARSLSTHLANLRKLLIEPHLVFTIEVELFQNAVSLFLTTLCNQPSEMKCQRVMFVFICTFRLTWARMGSKTKYNISKGSKGRVLWRLYHSDEENKSWRHL